MKLPRDVSGADLVKALRTLGYQVTRQTGSHMRITTGRDGEHHETIPTHAPIKVGTLHNILKSVAVHHGMTIDELCSHLPL